MRMTWRFDRRRRRFLRTAGAAAATVTLGPLLITERTIAQMRTLYVNSWGGSFTAAQDAAYFKPFTAATGIQIRTVTPVSYAKIKAQVQASRYEFDMTSINSMQWLRASREGLAEPIDWTIFKKDTLPPDAIVANGHGVASNIQGTNLCYRSDKFPADGPKSWADFWDVKRFPGARGLCINDSPRTLIFCLARRRRAGRSALSAGRRPSVQKARSDQAIHQSVVAGGQSIAAAHPRRRA